MLMSVTWKKNIYNESINGKESLIWTKEPPHVVLVTLTYDRISINRAYK